MLVIISILQVLVLLEVVKVHGSPFVELKSPQDDQVTNNFKPSIAVVIGILSIMFSLTFLLLLYAKYCRRSPPPPVQNTMQQGVVATVLPIARTSSGIDKTVIQSLPFFRFSLLKGSKQGLECAVCLSRFEDVEVLRLLPRCKHAFHINCIDQWLEKHSSCPLCRHRVSAEDKTLLTYSNSFRFLSELREDSNLELYVQREDNRSSRFSIGSISFKKSEKGSSRRLREDEISIQEDNMSFLDYHDGDHTLHKFNHKIVVSDVVLKHRWSNVSSSDFMFLNSEMIRDMTSSTSNRFLSEITTTTEGVLRQNEKRSMSEILICPRFDEFSTRNCCNREEKRRKLWVPIATRTVQWFENREKRYAASQTDQNTRVQSFNV